MRKILVSAAFLAISAPAFASDTAAMGGMPPMTFPPMPAIYAGQPEKQGAPLFDGYGDHHHPISTKNPKTQAYFDQGVRMLFAFNHPEAIRSFREAARLDPHCAMCWWGVGFALGSNINLPMQHDAAPPAWAALEMARALAGVECLAGRDRMVRGDRRALCQRAAEGSPSARRGVRGRDGQALARLP